MDNSFHQQGSNTQEPQAPLASPPIVDSLLNWLKGLIRLTDEERADAGIYLDGQNHT
jgi:hypothetical protein